MTQSRTYTINNSSVTLRFGDILDSRAEALVISGSVGIPMKGGLPDYVRSKGGNSILIDAQKYPDAKLGDVVVTSAGRLPNKYLFQAVTVVGSCQVLPHLSDDENTEAIEYVIGHAISKSLRLLSALDLHSIAFPCLGLGMANMSLNAVAKLTAKTICQFLWQTNKSIEVEIYIYDSYDVYRRLDYLPFFEWMATYSYEINKSKIKGETEEYTVITSGEVEDMKGEMKRIDDAPHRIFLSYSRKDADKVNIVCRLLNEMNIPYWIDRKGVFSGSNFKELIVKAISTTDIVLFFSSENSNKSLNVAKEISIADQFGKTIIPLRLDDSPMHPKISYDLAGIDFLDLFTFDEKNLQKLRNAILGQLAMISSK